MTAAAGKYAGLDRFECPQAHRRGHAGARAHRPHRALPPRRRASATAARRWWSRSSPSSGTCNVKPLAEPAHQGGARRADHDRPARRGRKTYYHWMENIRAGASRASSGGATASRRGTATRTAACTSRAPTSRACPQCGGAAPPGPRRARHVVLLRALAVLHPGLARRHAGARRRTTRPRCWSPASTSSSSGSRGWPCSACTFMGTCRSATSTSTPSCATPRGRRCRSRRATSSTRSRSWSKYGTDAFRFTLAALAAPGARHPDRRGAHRGLPQLRQQALERVAPGAVQPRRLRSARWPDAARPPAGRPLDPEPAARRRSPRCARRSTPTGSTTRRPRVYQFLWHEFCDWYLEIAKPSALPAGRARRRSAVTQQTLVDVARDDAAAAPPVHAVHHRGASGSGCPTTGESIMIAPFPTAADAGAAMPEAERAMEPA